MRGARRRRVRHRGRNTDCEAQEQETRARHRAFTVPSSRPTKSLGETAGETPRANLRAKTPRVGQAEHFEQLPSAESWERAARFVGQEKHFGQLPNGSPNRACPRRMQAARGRREPVGATPAPLQPPENALPRPPTHPARAGRTVKFTFGPKMPARRRRTALLSCLVYPMACPYTSAVLGRHATTCPETDGKGRFP